MVRSADAYDPLTAAMAPPEGETDEERATREHSEEQARKVSQQIDERINLEKMAMKKRPKPIKVLLLGQSESGKSTTIKNFQLAYAHKAWTAERASWRAVVDLNLVRSVNTITDAITAESALMSPRGSTLPLVLSDEEDDDQTTVEPPRRPPRTPPINITEHLKLLRMRLSPLKRVQDELEFFLGSASSEVKDMSVLGTPTSAAPFTEYENAPDGTLRSNPHRPREFFVRSNRAWKSALDTIRTSASSRTSGSSGEHRLADQARQKHADDAAEVIISCREDIKALWSDDIVHRILARRNIRMEDSPGFFLNDVDRIAGRNYEPSDDDVVRARLRTVGIQEYSFVFEKRNGDSVSGREWLMYDVAGSRTSRAAWFPFFDDVNAIIFMAPISCFDETLAEDKRVNRLQDSILLWKYVCSSKILVKVQLILFLNKIDLLAKKLKRGNVLVRDFVPSYRQKPNTFEEVSEYFKSKFKDILRAESPERRPFYAHLTSVVDTKATAKTLSLVQDGILRDHLKHADFL